MMASVLLAACSQSTKPAPTATITTETVSQPTATQAALAPNQPSTDATAPATRAASGADETVLPNTTGIGITPLVDATQVTAPTAVPVEEAPATPTAAAPSSGEELTALQALVKLKPVALAWHADARFGMLANARPGMENEVLGGALGAPDVSDPTPGGKGRNWVLVAFSPSAQTAAAIGPQGKPIDLTAGDKVPAEIVAQFTGPGAASLALESLDTSRFIDSDKVAATKEAANLGRQPLITLLAPNGLGAGPLPTPAGGGPPAQIAYELSGGSGGAQGVVFFDAASGQVLLNTATP